MAINFKAMAAIFVLLLSGTASALATQATGYVNIGETPQEYSFLVENTSAIKKTLKVSFTAPTKTELSKKPAFVGANSSEEVAIRIYPQEGFEGSTYTGKLFIDLGGDVAEKIVTLTYTAEDSCPVEVTINSDKNTNKVGISFRNNSFKEKKIELIAVKAGEANWAMTGERRFEVNGFETRAFETSIERPMGFNGEAGFVFKCGNAGFTKKHNFEASGKNSFEGAISGFAVAAQAASKDIDFITSVFLGVIAAVLLLAFIARLARVTHRNNREKQ